MAQFPLRPNVCMLLINSNNKLFMGERHGTPGHWQFPQGGVEGDLSIEENVVRELHEELGAPITCFEIIKKFRATYEYDWDKVPDYAKGKWRGQSQTFWLVRFTGRDSDIQLDRYHPEFRDFKWCSVYEVPNLAPDRRQRAYAEVLREFSDYLLLGDE